MMRLEITAPRERGGTRSARRRQDHGYEDEGTVLNPFRCGGSHYTSQARRPLGIANMRGILAECATGEKPYRSIHIEFHKNTCGWEVAIPQQIGFSTAIPAFAPTNDQRILKWPEAR
jgi:hypothetical protein